MPRSLLWQELSDPEIAEMRDAGALVVVPVGAIEQHARQLPADADIASSSAISLAAARCASVPILVAPGLPFGFSPHHLSWAATIGLRLSTFLSVLRDVAGSILETGFPRVLFVNGHGGNTAPLRALVGELVTDGLAAGAVDYFAPSEREWLPLLSGVLQRVGHACEFETALVAHLRAADPMAAERIIASSRNLPPRPRQPWIAPGHADDPITEAGAAWPPIFQADDCGYYGDPAAATAELGRKLYAVVTDGLARFFDEFATTPLRLGVARDPSTPKLSAALRR